MKLIRLILIVAFAGTAFAADDLPDSLKGLILVDMTGALKMHIPASDVDVKIREAAIREASTLFHLNPGALAEFEALTDRESGGSPISAATLQEVMNDFESLAEGKAVPTLISFYIAKSKVEALSPRQRVLCYVMIKSAMRHIRATQNQK